MAITPPTRRLHGGRLAWSQPAGGWRLPSIAADHHDAREGGPRMKRLLSLGMAVVAVLAALLLFASSASASEPKDCLAQRHVCVSSDGRGLITPAQQARLEQQIGRDDIYL